VPAPALARAEFNRPPAPPVTVDGLARRPVTLDNALPVPTVKLPEPTDGGTALLPTRTPSRGPDGPDRLAGVGDGSGTSADAPVVAGSSPSALQAALTAFDSRRHAGQDLPTRSRSGDSFAPPSAFEEPPSIAASQLDPDALRQRLRAFQTEFRTAAERGTHNHSHSDLGGDR
jgi:hypothetical protein